MNGEVQLIVNNIGPANVASMSNDPTLMGIGALSRFVVTSSPEIAALPLAQPITIYNAAGDSVTKTLNSIVIDSPVPGQTRLNLAGTWSDDYSAAAGGYIIVQTGTQYYIDLYENESISQNWKFQDLSNFTAQGAFSREFRLPFSETNKEALGALFDNNVEQGAENYFFYKLPAEIRVDTLPIATGYLRVRKVYKQMGKLNEVEVAFYAETPDLVRTIGEKKLSDIAALADLNEAVTYANVTTETADRIWALCDRGQKWSNDGSTGSRPILSPSAPLYPADLTPSVSWWFLLRNIVTEAGFELVASSLENILNDYWMPFCNTPQLSYTGGSNQYFFSAYPNAPFEINLASTTNSSYSNMVENFDNNGDFNAVTGVYTASAVGTFTYHVHQIFSVDGYNNTNYVIINLRIYKNGSFLRFISNYFSVLPFSFVTQYGLFDQTFNLDLEIGDQIFFEFTFAQATGVFGTDIFGNIIYSPVDYFETGTFIVNGVAGDGTTNASYIEINSANITVGQTIDYALNAPDMRQIDFVNDVIKMHNCAIVPSRIVPNQIAIIPQNNYLGTGDVVDWTGKLDISKDVMMGSTVDVQKATFQFTYTAGEDAYSKLYKDANRVYGDFKSEGYTINPSTAPSDFAIGDQKIQLVTRSAPAALIPGTSTPIQCFYNEQLEFVAPGPRCLYNANQDTVNLYNELTSATPLTNVPVLNHYSNTYPTVDDYDLNWAPEVPPHVVTVSANPYNNLFNLYWRNYMNEIYSPEGRIMEAFFALDLKDILTFSFADKIWIQDSYWRILEITDYKVGYNESTKVKLIKFLDQINDCSSTPYIVTANGEVTFVDGEGDAVEPTEDCCSRYGYFWDEINGVCWAFNNGGQFRNSIVSSNPVVSNNPTLEALSNAPLSVVNGSKLSIVPGNSGVLMVGQDLSLTKSVRRSNLLGTNATTNLPGLHVGGGYRSGDSSNTETGWAQSGIAHFHVKDSFASAGASHELLIEGVAGEHLEIPDSTTMSCMLNLTIQDEMQTDIDVAILSFGLTKVGGIAYATAVTVISNDTFGTGYTYAIDIDTTTNTDQHRIVLTINAAPSFPITLISTASLHYQQNKLT
jgi:hypothetical protein